MSKIVAVSCSPRSDAASSRISDAFLDGAMGLSTNIIKLHRLTSLKEIHDCNMCQNCKKVGKCTIEDDIAQVLDDIWNADCVVFSTPVYFDGACGLYKLVEDRMESFMAENNVSKLPKGKKALLIVTAFNPETKLQNISKKMSRNIEKFGFDVMGVITYCDHMGTRPVDDNPIVLQEAKKMGLTLRNTPVV